MKEFKNVDEILVFAIEQEQKAVDFYTGLAKEAHSEEMKKVFLEFAGEEIKHKQRLTRIREEGVFSMPKQLVADLKIGDYIVDVKASGKLSYEDALVLAMKREKAAFRLYSMQVMHANGYFIEGLWKGDGELRLGGVGKSRNGYAR